MSFFKNLRQRFHSTKSGQKAAEKAGSAPKNISTRQVWSRIRRKYPILYKMFLRDRAPSGMRDHLQRQAANEIPGRKPGAVRKVYYDNGKVGYSVLILSSDDITQAGFSGKRDKEFGRFIKDIRHNEIFTVTMLGDAYRGAIVICPDSKTLKLLHTYDELDNVKYQWGIFPRDVTVSTVNTHTIRLSNLSQINELLNISKHNLPLIVRDGQIDVANVNKPNATTSSEAASIPTENNSSSESNSTSESESTEMPNFDTSDMSNNDSNDSSNNGSKSTSTSHSSIQNTNQISNNSESEDEGEPKVVTDDSDDSSGSDDDNNDDAQFESEFESMAQDDSAQAKANSEYEQNIQQNPTHETRQSLNGEPQQKPAQQTKAQFVSQMNNTTNHKFYDDTLGVSVDANTSLDEVFARQKPALFHIKKYKNNNKLGQMLNEIRKEYNSQLLADYQRVQNVIWNNSLSQLDNVTTKLEHNFDENDTRNIYGQRKNQIQNNYEKQLTFDKQNNSKFVQYARQQLNKRRKAAGQRAAQDAYANFDEENQDWVNEAVRSHTATTNTHTRRAYMRQLHDLGEKKRQAANAIIHTLWSHIITDARANSQDMYQKVSTKRHKMQSELINIAEHYYQTETENEQNQADIASNQTDIKRLRRQIATQRANNQQELKNERIDYENSRNEMKNRFNRILKRHQEKENGLRKHILDADKRAQKAISPHVRDLERANKGYEASLKQKNLALRDAIKSSHYNDKVWTNPWVIGGLVCALLVGGVSVEAYKGLSTHHNIPIVQQQSSSNQADSARSSASSSASSYASSVSASASSASASNNASSGDSSNHSEKLMTTRPAAGDDYIATSETHSPTNYVKISKSGNFTTGSTVKGLINGKSQSLNVITASGNQIYVKDSNNGQIYEFNK